MPSDNANRVIELVAKLIDRELTAEEKLNCENMVYNVFTGPICRYVGCMIKSVHKKNKKRPNFPNIYFPIINGVMVGARRKEGKDQFFFDSDVKRQVYARVHMYLGDGFSASDLDCIVWLATHTTPGEVQSAIDAATFKGIRNACYVRSIVVGNRRRATAQLAAHNTKYAKITDDPPNISIGVPDVMSLQKNWQRKLKDAVDHQRTTNAEREGRKKIDL